MGYNNLKMPWDLAELKKEGIPAIFPSTSSFGAYKSARDCLVDLKLGRLGDPGEGLVGKFRVPHASAMDPPSGPSRKARARGNRAQVPSCLVDGCRSDLSTCRDYYRRHKVCEVHSKTPIVTIGGQERRFCQQCSRFHSLVEFDEGKRSCRKRLDGHNRRRRKPQPQSITLNPERFLSNHPGARYLPFSNNPQVCATTRSLIKAENDPMLYSNTHSLISLAAPADRKNPFPVALPAHGYSFSQGATSALPGDSLSQAFPDPDDDGLNRAIASDHHRALSLLSSPPPSKTREFGFGSAVHASASSLISFSGYSNLRPPIGLEGHHFLDSDSGCGGANVHSQGTLRPDGSASAVMPHQTLFFSWE